ncbi:MAG: hypothetical protein ACYC44_00555 [Patescibacteria group bacterium]
MDKKVSKFELFLMSVLDYLASSALLLALLTGALYLMNVVIFDRILGFEWSRCNGPSAVTLLLGANFVIVWNRQRVRGWLLEDDQSSTSYQRWASDYFRPIRKIVEGLVMIAIALVAGFIMNVASHYFGI